ncbi:lipopolysaccharide biosynthesis protein [Bariatricus sp. SGI.019]|uniref:lipopolysaccharide biosynthesis protein n=1 Tax=Bariatricus sp. SGI.019 TaxID=3420548 RepID=UPI003D032CE5
MRSKNAFQNVLSAIVLQLIIVVTGIYIPQLMIVTYGSSVNGMVSSITQFITYISLVEAGIGNASLVALFLPLAENNYRKINGIMSATCDFYLKAGGIFAVLLIGLSIVYPFFSEGGIDVSLIRWMVIILGSSTLIDFLVLGKYKVFLNANQKGYIVTVTQSIGTVLNALVCILMIKFQCNILAVKAVSTFVYILRTVFIYGYVKRNYHYLSFKEKPIKEALIKRWDVLTHQITGVIVNSTDVVVLTIFLKNFSEISVYTVYNLIVSNIITLLDSFSSSLCAVFGDAFAKKEMDIVRDSYMVYEYLFFIISFIACTCMMILMIPFMEVYTVNITDAKYIRPITAMLFTIILICRSIRTPSLTMLMAAGHYKETKNAAIIEAIINITVSLLLVKRMGINGVLIGTVCSYFYRTVDMIGYVGKNIVNETLTISISRVIRNLVIMFFAFWINCRISYCVKNWLEWFVYAMVVGIICVIIFGLTNTIFEPKMTKNVINIIERVLKKK